MIYDHEDEILTATMHPDPEQSLMASIDSEGQVLVRDVVNHPADAICSMKPCEGVYFEPIDTA